MNEPDSAESIAADLSPVASYRHTAILVAILLAIAAAGALFQRGAGPAAETTASHPDVVPLYLSLLVAEWALLFYTWRIGLRPHGVRLGDLIGGRWSGWSSVLRDLGLAIGVWLVWLGIERAGDLWLGPGHARSIGAYLPQRPLEVGFWILLSLSAGFCEEVVFRGYLQRQLAAATRSRPLGLILQAVIFGVAHGYQGVAAALRITVFGLLYGGLTLWRGSVRPGIAAHAWTDIWSGWLASLLR
jgi:membrane protease YdiL (CAAX protease family)